MAILKYALARVVVLLAVAGALHLLGARSWLMWLGAFLIAAMVSYILLPGTRDEAAGVLARQDGHRTRVDADADEEDALLGETTGDGYSDRSPQTDPSAATSDGDDGPDGDADPTALPAADTAPRGDLDLEGSTLENVPDAVEDAPRHHGSDRDVENDSERDRA